MDIVRNFIHVVGITPGEELPEKIGGQIIEFSEAETLSIPMDKPPAQNIFQVMIQVEVVSSRRIHAQEREIVVVDGVKEFKIIYGAKEDSDNAGLLVLRIPFNTFYELPEGRDGTEKVNVYVLDAYFQLLDERKVYAHVLYYIHIQYEQENIKRQSQKEKRKLEIDSLSFEEDEEMLLYSVPQSVMEEILVSKEFGTGDDSIEIEEKTAEGARPKNLMIDLDAEYL